MIHTEQEGFMELVDLTLVIWAIDTPFFLFGGASPLLSASRELSLPAFEKSKMI